MAFLKLIKPRPRRQGANRRTVLPPPTEVKIRTMRSDIDSMNASGGGMPKFKNVKVSGLALEKMPGSTPAMSKHTALMVAIITIIALAVLGLLIYFGYKIVAGGSA